MLSGDTPLAIRFLCLAAAIFFATGASAVDIRLTNGVHYKEVSVVRITATTYVVQTQHGEIEIPRDKIASIDGKPMTAPSGAGAPPAESSPSKPAQAPDGAGAQPPGPAPTPTMIPAETARDNQPDEPAKEAPEKTPAAVASPAAPPSPAMPAYEHDSRMDWALAGIFLGCVLWVAHLVWVQRDLNRRAKAGHTWNAIVLCLPLLGAVLYLIERTLHRQRHGEALFGGKKDVEAAASKKKIFLSNDPNAPKGQGIGLQFLDADNQPVEPVAKNGEELNGLAVARDILEAAVIQRASDVHIEPQSSGCRIRFRVDGELYEQLTLQLDEGRRLTAALKSLAEIDIAEKRKAQDGRFSVRTDLRSVDFRVATANSIYGEKVVVRVLDQKASFFDLDRVGMNEQLKQMFDRGIHSRAGMIIVTGPTGSGKTSTLYAALTRLDREKLNVMTVEDPVEYELAGATQLPVNPKAGITYESGLRSILRQDPDVILIGEMRDAEAATIAIRAALTGHLVFTSLHTRDAISTLVRLEEMGIERSQLASGLLMLMAQRLVRVLCPACRVPYACTGGELIEIGIRLPEGETIYKAGGCAACDHTGFHGRTGIFELVVMNDEIRQLVATGADQQEFTTACRERGFESYREDGARKVLEGITTVEEVLQAT